MNTSIHAMTLQSHWSDPIPTSAQEHQEFLRAKEFKKQCSHKHIRVVGGRDLTNTLYTCIQCDHAGMRKEFYSNSLLVEQHVIPDPNDENNLKKMKVVYTVSKNQ